MCVFVDVLAMYIPTGGERISERAAIPIKHSSQLTATTRSQIQKHPGS